MEISRYNFFFHPFHEEHPKEISALSVITNIALTALTAGLYLVAFLGVHLSERHWVQKQPDPKSGRVPRPATIIPRANGFVGSQALKQKLQSHLAKLTDLAERGQWQHLQTHTAHPDSGFDWWMFPIDRSSRGMGDLYNLSQADISFLKNDPEFMKSYREGVCLVAKSWGWDLLTRTDLTSYSQRWTGYQVRLYKMITSLELFNQTDLTDSLRYFMNMKGVTI